MDTTLYRTTLLLDKKTTSIGYSIERERERKSLLRILFVIELFYFHVITILVYVNKYGRIFYKISDNYSYQIMNWSCEEVLRWCRTFIDDDGILSRIEGQTVLIKMHAFLVRKISF